MAVVEASEIDQDGWYVSWTNKIGTAIASSTAPGETSVGSSFRRDGGRAAKSDRACKRRHYTGRN